jgi:hypothetical protein
MNQREIRENCYRCSNRSLLLMRGSPLPTDFCDIALMECGLILYCDPAVRKPKKKEVRYKKAVQ